MDREFEQLKKDIMLDVDNKVYSDKGIEPLFSAPRTAKILIIGQAPGIKAQESRIFFNDKSGVKLREWMGIDNELFYNSGLIGVVPMDFYYPGKGKSGDLPPRKNFAHKWHPRVLELMPDIKLIILVGKYAQDYYLKDKKEKNLTETVKNYKKYLPKYFPIVHPSPLNFRWQAKNPWFLEEVVPVLKKMVEEYCKV
ncbi:uracil-DNA glycosylase family protein [Gemella morbillorum]|uniref:uracil-DNA glycosylase family protein n=1 Tax=Gemella morbillorum TaxID=29391 RepID=UPI0023F0DA1C|nr:uracil-DNA glycosylase family protein [Gemella morbillorum]